MIKTLRRKFIAATMLSLAAVLLVILGGVNLMSYQKVISDADAILELLCANSGTFPEFPAGKRPAQTAVQPPVSADKRGFGERGLSPETPYESRYFSVVLDEAGQVVYTDTVQIAAIDGDTAASYAQAVWQSGRTSGFWEDYRYACRSEANGWRIIFLDCGRTLSGFRTTLLASMMLALVGLGAVLVLLLILSGRIIRPVAESYEKQKQFITDAGHELKTPLTIISADTDLAEMECGENEWLEDIRRQAQRLTGLTEDLIYLSRMEEAQPRLQFLEFPISDVVEEMAQSFVAPARSQDKNLDIEVRPMISCNGDEKAVRQLVSILMDNALKYAPPGGQLALRLERQGRAVVLTVSNTTVHPVDKESLEHLFDRFYRGDQSRNTQTGGYGLGLSIAKSIVAAHRGKIRAESPAPDTLMILVTLPG